MIPTRHSQAAVFVALFALLLAAFAQLWSDPDAVLDFGPGRLLLGLAVLATTAALAFVNRPGLARTASAYLLAVSVLALAAGLVVGVAGALAACAIASLLLGDLAWGWRRQAPRPGTAAEP